MPAKLSLKGIEPVLVDLNGTEFDAVPATKSVAEQLDAAWTAYVDADGADASIEALGHVFDLRLRARDGGKRKPSDVVRDMWNGEQATFPQLVAFLQEAGSEADRPTSQQ